MTRERIYGSDTEFCKWMRSCKDLPSYSKDCGFVAADNDLTLHRYMTAVDRAGSRQVQALMQVEIKTRCGKPPASQLDTLSKLNLFSGNRNVGGTHIRFFGVFILVLSGECPDTSEQMWWYSLPRKKVVKNASLLDPRTVNKQELIKLFRFEIHPVNFSVNTFRRHHQTSRIIETVSTELGFEVDEEIVKRS